LRKRRLDQGLLQREVAQRLGVHKTTICNWETNHTSPQLRFIPRIIEFLGYMPDDTQAESLCQQIVAVRRRLGLSQRKLDRRLGADPGTLGQWGRGAQTTVAEMEQEAASLIGWPSAEFYRTAATIGPS